MTETKTTPPVPLEDQICYSIYSAAMAIQRIYKPLLDGLGLTYPQYLVLNVLWRQDRQTVGGIAAQLALESSTVTPLLKRLEAAGLVERTRSREDERQVLVALSEQGRALRSQAGCLGESLLAASGQSPEELGKLNGEVKQLRDAIYSQVGGWSIGAQAEAGSAKTGDIPHSPEQAIRKG
ncbi:MarR family winged helix-turn-helix transcriptional regulator [Aurantimonas endophytica]|uniref:DNA-binding MarR family transcriptional regulator n=1 Tax=Aurantimonas endophytica TaxID=1522175 RepID=A0A7W6HE65_9HYPH|nr:MarR family transcriptional regulator [Aurantimonas endophytica]MBB4003625.1 DNA-binding MarR family transcriptional regulator [Aurantimonas endophytica]MCO6404483.1 MarR family transcriptional regulator [Aurantimonas endophytica]